MNAQARPKSRKQALTLLAAAVVVAGVAYGAYWGLHGRYHIETDDAYVAGHMVAITPLTGGTVSTVMVDDTDFVKTGQVLVKLDPADAELAYQRARAALADAVRSTRGATFSADSAAAQVAAREIDLQKAEGDLARREKLVGTDAVTPEDLAHARDAVAAARAALDVANRNRSTARAQVLDSPIAEQPKVAQAAAALKEAYLARKRNTVVAPVDGYVARRSVQVGQRVAAGTPMMAVVPLRDVWVDANYKEVQLDRVRIGQPVKLEADLYGGKIEYTGKVAGVSAGTGSAFSLLPAQNATGNWIKVVQRLPVRVTLDPKQLETHPLRVGLSMTVNIDTRDESGRILADAPPAGPASHTGVYAQDLADADALVADVIAANAGK
ncbi:EmrA/EmrK family multidrug efflux transporter periplasmic adaptor subunit [Microvirgula aerodenitrificans]|uniref:EmrA/EmrK family multidrug efflux transporter periplasmic adaptor subunit n=1 Tax=Microvirgula aerodenitrificans TaxID=57480 RepID=A0A2S0P872_9NEIS|nr:HlyD family efflux transporter periplasmic adaptor subunit [Microvirgula aerodenitrificans]AVY93542.1 EmrA/EmrK family multidrug efflux transporter periplasmic adaptor subunit [Microvirgula aerodenitrificans]